MRAEAPARLGLADPLLEHLEAHLAVHPEQPVVARAEHVAVARTARRRGPSAPSAARTGRRAGSPGRSRRRPPRRSPRPTATGGTSWPPRVTYWLRAGVAVDEDHAHVADDPPAEAADEVAGVGVERRAHVGDRSRPRGDPRPGGRAGAGRGSRRSRRSRWRSRRSRPARRCRPRARRRAARPGVSVSSAASRYSASALSSAREGSIQATSISPRRTEVTRPRARSTPM